jgi:hypothetical protein
LKEYWGGSQFSQNSTFGDFLSDFSPTARFYTYTCVFAPFWCLLASFREFKQFLVDFVFFFYLMREKLKG